MARISLLRLLIAAVGPLAATAAERGDRRVVLGGRSMAGSGWTRAGLDPRVATHLLVDIHPPSARLSILFAEGWYCDAAAADSGRPDQTSSACAEPSHLRRRGPVGAAGWSPEIAWLSSARSRPGR